MRRTQAGEEESPVYLNTASITLSGVVCLSRFPRVVINVLPIRGGFRVPDFALMEYSNYSAALSYVTWYLSQVESC